MNKLVVDRTLFKLLRSRGVDEFSMDEICNLYPLKSHKGESLDISEVKKLIGKYFHVLEKKKFIHRISVSTGSGELFKFDESSTDVALIVKEGALVDCAKSSDIDFESYGADVKLEARKLEQMYDKYSCELTEIVSEANEYVALLDMFPDANQLIDGSIYSAKIRASEVSGRIKAVETFLSYYEGTVEG